MKYGRPALYKDTHLPMARALYLQEKGHAVTTPPRAFTKRAAMIQGRGGDFTLDEMSLADFIVTAGHFGEIPRHAGE
jgi:hypothetical protein